MCTVFRTMTMTSFVFRVGTRSVGEVSVSVTLSLGAQIWAQTGSDCPQIRQIREFFSDSVHFVSQNKNVTDINRIVPTVLFEEKML